MITRLLSLLLALSVNVALIAPALADQSETQVVTNNQTTDAWVWITAYTRVRIDAVNSYGEVNKGAWCVRPGQTDQHGLKAWIVEVRSEVTMSPNCAHPVIWNAVWYLDPYARTGTYTLTGHGGKYKFLGGDPAPMF
jgi:hypothetical protein